MEDFHSTTRQGLKVNMRHTTWRGKALLSLAKKTEYLNGITSQAKKNQK